MPAFITEGIQNKLKILKDFSSDSQRKPSVFARKTFGGHYEKIAKEFHGEMEKFLVKFLKNYWKILREKKTERAPGISLGKLPDKNMGWIPE